MVNAKGVALTHAETVTLFNDLCCLAPGALLSPEITWEPIDKHTATAHFTLGPNTITAELRFDDLGDLVDFVADGRGSMSPDGHTLTTRPPDQHGEGSICVPQSANPPTRQLKAQGAAQERR